MKLNEIEIKLKDRFGVAHPFRYFDKNLYMSYVLGHDYLLPYVIDKIQLKFPNGAPAEKFYAIWTFKDESFAIQRRKEKTLTFISELWEVKNAAKRLGLEVII